MLFRRRAADLRLESEALPLDVAMGSVASAMDWEVAGSGSVGQAVGYALTGRRLLTLAQETDLDAGHESLERARGLGLPLVVVVRIEKGLEGCFRVGSAGIPVLLAHGPDDVAAVVTAAMLAAGASTQPIVVAVPDGLVRPLLPDASASVKPTKWSAFGLNPATPSGHGQTAPSLQSRLASQAYGVRAVADHIDQALATVARASGVDLAPIVGLSSAKGPILAGAFIPAIPRGVQCANVCRLYPPPVPSGSAADRTGRPPRLESTSVAFPAEVAQVQAWQAETALQGTTCIFGMDDVEPPWDQVLAHLGKAGVLFVGGPSQSQAATLPPEGELGRTHALSALEGVVVLESPKKRHRPELDGDQIPHALTGRRDLEDFWRRQGFVRRQGQASSLWPAPEDASGRMPALSAVALQPPSAPKAPEVNPATCTGCGICWASCPESAIRPRRVDFSEVLTTSLVSIRPAPVRLARLIKPLATVCARTFRDDGVRQYPTLDALVAEGLERLLPKTDLTPEQADEARGELGRLKLPALPLVPVLDSGVALALGIDADRCTGCGVCALDCPELALDLRADLVFDPYHTGIPDVGTADLDFLAAATGSEAVKLSHTLITGPSSDRPGLTLAVRQVLSARQNQAESRQSALNDRIAMAASDLETRAQALVDRAAHIHDFDRLAARLDGLRAASLEVVSEAGGGTPLETRRLRELAEARALLAPLVETPPRGPIVLLGDGVPVPKYPHNPYGFEWIATGRETARIAKGLLDGLTRQAAEQASRLASAEGSVAGTGPRPIDPDVLLAMTPDLVVLTTVIDSQITNLLQRSESLHVILLVDDPIRMGDVLLGLALTGSYSVAQVSPGDPDHLVRAISSLTGPTLVAVHVPEPESSTKDAPTPMSLGQQAMAAGVWPLLTAIPGGDGPRIALRNAPSASGSAQGPGAATGSGSTQGPPAATGRTPLDWMARQPVYAPHFEFLFAHARPTDGVPAFDWMRTGQGTPVVEIDGKRIAIPNGKARELARRCGKLHRRIEAASKPASLGTAGDAGIPPRSEPALQDPAPAAVPTLADRLLRLSGFGPGSDGASATLRDYVRRAEEAAADAVSTEAPA